MKATSRRPTAIVSFTLALAGCGAPEPPGNTGGTEIPAGPCGRGAVVVSSDYHSTNVSLVSWSGEVLSASFVSSASSGSGSLSAPLSGDVVTPSATQGGDSVVLVDRYPAGVLTWVDVESGEPVRQLDLKTGFASNPQDYIGISSRKAYVSRLEENLEPGLAPFDAGSDLLIVDPASPAISGRIDLHAALEGEDPAFLPRPNKLLVDGPRLYALLSAYDASFQASAASRVVTIDTNDDSIRSVTVLPGLHGCTGMALSPSGEQLAVVCSGTFEGSSASVEEAGIALFTTSPELSEIARFPASRLGGRPLGFSIAFAAERRLVTSTFGELTGESRVGDTLVSLDLDSGAHQVLRTTDEPFTIGEVRCATSCSVCFATDASGAGALVRYPLTGGVLGSPSEIRPDTAIGLPPRYLGGF
jgi:hypothetical protein